MTADPRKIDIKAGPDEMKFRIVVKLQNEVLLDFTGFPKRLVTVTAKDMADAFLVERIIEKLIGLRVHILQVVDEFDTGEAKA